jgi:hypothetical protein
LQQPVDEIGRHVALHDVALHDRGMAGLEVRGDAVLAPDGPEVVHVD